MKQMTAAGEKPRTRVSNDAFLVALKSVLASEYFVRSDRLSGFLSYIVKESIAGRGTTIRAKTIAMDVYQRDPAISGQSENVVRVDARRLRRSLEEYYTNEGRDDAARIWVDAGAYVPRLEVRRDVTEKSRTNRPGKNLAVAAGFVVVTLVGATVILQGASKRPTSQQGEQIVLERQALREKSVATLQAANFAEQARGFLFPLLEPERQSIANDMFQQVIRLDPDYFGGYAGAAQALTTMSKLLPPGPERDAALAQALRQSQIAVVKNPTHAWTQSAVAWVAFGNGEFEHAFELSGRSAHLAPEDGYILDFHGIISLLTGHFKEALLVSDPTRPREFAKRRLANRNIFGVANFHLGNNQEAIASFQRAAELGDPVSALSLMYQSAAYQDLGDFEQASGLVRELAATWPGFRPDLALPRFYQHQKHVDQILDQLRLAGWKPLNQTE